MTIHSPLLKAFGISLLVHAACITVFTHSIGNLGLSKTNGEKYREGSTIRLTLRTVTLTPQTSKTREKARSNRPQTITRHQIQAPDLTLGYKEESASLPSSDQYRHYHAPNELTRRPQLREAFELEPELLFTDSPGEGKLVLKLYLSEEGTIDRIAIDSSNIPKDIEQRLVRSFQRIKYQAAEKDRQPVSSWIRIEITLLPPEVLPNSLP